MRNCSKVELDNETTRSDQFGLEQRKDPEVLKIFQYIKNETLPEEEKEAKRIVLQSNFYSQSPMISCVSLTQNRITENELLFQTILDNR